MRAGGGDGQRRLEVRVAFADVELPLGIAKEIAAETRWRRLSNRRASDGESLDDCAIEANLELVGLGPALDAVDLGAEQPHLDVVVAGDREVVPDRDAAPRSERQVFAHAIVLVSHEGHIVGFAHRPDRRPAGRHT